MRNTWVVGMAVGALIGALIVEGSEPAANMVAKGKRVVKSKIDSINNPLR